MKIIAPSDTHGLHQALQIPDGDILIHAGDLTRPGTLVGVSKPRTQPERTEFEDNII